MTYKKPTTISEAWSNPRYQGKIVVAVAGEFHSTTKDEQAVKIYRKLKKKYPDKTPITTVIPKKMLTVVSLSS